MPDDVRVSLESMTRYAAAADHLSEQFEQVRRMLIDADVAEDSFGMLPESREVADAYTQRCEDGLEVLRDGARAFSSVGDAFRQMRDEYQANEEVGAASMDGVLDD